MHNRHVVETLAARGAVFVAETDEVPEGATVVFSAHGVAPTVRESATARELQVIDATCPLVTKVHNEAKRFAREDYDILLIGHEGHEEVVGTAGEAPEHVQLVDGPDGVAGVTVRDEDKVVWLSQTTLSVDETMDIVNGCASAFRSCRTRPATTSATPHRTGRPRSRRWPRVRPGDRGGFPQLVELGAPGRGGIGRRRRCGAPGGLCRGHQPGLAGGRDDRRGDLRGLGARILVTGVLERLAESGFGTVQSVTTANGRRSSPYRGRSGRPGPDRQRTGGPSDGSRSGPAQR